MIRISLLGQVSVIGRNGRQACLGAGRATELFAFLVLEGGRSIHRSRLAELFWGHLPEERGRRALNTELWRVTRALAAVGVDVGRSLARSANEVGYVPQVDHQVDVLGLREAMRLVNACSVETVGGEELGRIEAGIGAYRGDLLESVYSDWCLVWRERLRAQFTGILEFLLRAAMHRHDWPAGLRFGQQLLDLDPLMEHVHRDLMRCHFHNGDRPLALRQFARCERILRNELGVEPMDETRRIQETLLAVSARPDEQSRARRSPAPRRIQSRTPAQKLDLAMSNLNSACHWVEEASQDLRDANS